LSGSVYDPSGAVLPGAEMTLTANQQLLAQVRTDASGRFQFTPVSAGHYTLGVAVAGFNPLQRDIDLQPGREWNQPITLQVGTLQETISVTDHRASTAAARAAAAGGPIRMGGNLKAPRKLVDVRPVYPRAMRDAGLEGVVPIEAFIGKDGMVATARVASALVHPEFAKAAIDAVRQWQFSPTLLNGEAVEVVMTVQVRFSLTD
jgi:protein TonB